MLQQFDSQTNDSFERLSESNQTEPPVDIYGASSPILLDSIALVEKDESNEF